MSKTFGEYEQDVSSFSGLSVDTIREIGSSEMLGIYSVNEINSNINTTQFYLKVDSTTWGDGAEEMPNEVYYGCLIPMVSDAMCEQAQQRKQAVERLIEGDSSVWFNNAVTAYKKPVRHYNKIYSKYKTLRTV